MSEPAGRRQLKDKGTAEAFTIFALFP